MQKIYEEILKWSLALPNWQRDALRRAVSAPLSGPDTEELLHLCLLEAGLTSPGYEGATAQVLEKKHLPLATSDTARLALDSVHSVQNVNILAPDSTLSFAHDGLTIVYGDNGTGKSGYVRILKKVCRARDGGTAIHPSIFMEQPAHEASATVTYAEGDQPLRSCQWNSCVSEEPQSNLSQISVFDSRCAALYVTAPNEIAYRPFGLDLFDRLAQTCDRVGRRIQEMIDSLPTRLPTPPDAVRNGPLFRRLFPEADVFTLAKVREAATLSADEKNELALLGRTLYEETPDRKAATLRSRKALLQTLLDRANLISAWFGRSSIEHLNVDLRALSAAREAHCTATDQAFRDLLPGTGGEPWRLLWEQARKFSQESAYNAELFPNTTPGAKCPLCQQPLHEDAKQRLREFERYVKAATAAEVDRWEALLSESRASINKLPLEDDADTAIFEEVSAHSQQLSDVVRQFMASAIQTRSELLAAIDGETLAASSACVFNPLPLQQIICEITSEITALGEQDQEQLKVRKARLIELQTKQWLLDNLPAIEIEASRIGTVSLLNKARKATVTNTISRKAADMTSEYVTAALQQSIDDELKAMAPNSLDISLKAKAIKGAISHSVEMTGSRPGKVPVEEVVSEGEFSSIALAIFLAEVGQSSVRSGIVVDDPVCSLDHLHRWKVAERLVKEAGKRQVIVFTHDLVFVRDLLNAAEACGQRPSTKHVMRGMRCTGVSCEDLPWDGKNAKARVGEIHNQISNLRKLYEEDRKAYDKEVQYWYGKMRETWERLVEELMLNSVVERFSNAIHTERVEKVVDLLPEDWQILNEGMSRTSRYLPGHDNPRPVGEPMPSPNEFEVDLARLSEYRKTLNSRRN
ncbi:MAG: AAA family ATPase [Armatimonadia bacterium]